MSDYITCANPVPGLQRTHSYLSWMNGFRRWSVITCPMDLINAALYCGQARLFMQWAVNTYPDEYLALYSRWPMDDVWIPGRHIYRSCEGRADIEEVKHLLLCASLVFQPMLMHEFLKTKVWFIESKDIVLAISKWASLMSEDWQQGTQVGANCIAAAKEIFNPVRQVSTVDPDDLGCMSVSSWNLAGMTRPLTMTLDDITSRHDPVDFSNSHRCPAEVQVHVDEDWIKSITGVGEPSTASPRS